MGSWCALDDQSLLAGGGVPQAVFPERHVV